MFTIVIVVVIVAFIAIFALQNATPVAISFLFWKVEASVAILIFLCTFAGVITGILISALLKLKLSNRSNNKEHQ
ncbi:MAG: LapA family protein [Thermodesulfovibrionales bacterium]|nr:LapA family protein [Thermodesulfovibrionales bacterium]